MHIPGLTMSSKLKINFEGKLCNGDLLCVIKINNAQKIHNPNINHQNITKRTKIL